MCDTYECVGGRRGQKKEGGRKREREEKEGGREGRKEEREGGPPGTLSLASNLSLCLPPSCSLKLHSLLYNVLPKLSDKSTFGRELVNCDNKFNSSANFKQNKYIYIYIYIYIHTHTHIPIYA